MTTSCTASSLSFDVSVGGIRPYYRQEKYLSTPLTACRRFLARVHRVDIDSTIDTVRNDPNDENRIEDVRSRSIVFTEVSDRLLSIRITHDIYRLFSSHRVRRSFNDRQQKLRQARLDCRQAKFHRHALITTITAATVHLSNIVYPMRWTITNVDHCWATVRLDWTYRSRTFAICSRRYFSRMGFNSSRRWNESLSTWSRRKRYRSWSIEMFSYDSSTNTTTPLIGSRIDRVLIYSGCHWPWNLSIFLGISISNGMGK
jgi:hypothetical protein